MNEQQKALVKATVPVLKTNGVALTKHFYQRMFTHNPELKNIFNQGHQKSGRQKEALAKADRLLLHAEFLSFAHPETGEVLSFNCPAEF